MCCTMYICVTCEASRTDHSGSICSHLFDCSTTSSGRRLVTPINFECENVCWADGEFIFGRKEHSPPDDDDDHKKKARDVHPLNNHGKF